MIKINLANSILKGKDVSSGPSGKDAGSLKDNLTKVALILLPTIGLMYYEKTDVEAKNIKLQEQTLVRDRISQELQQKGSVDEIVKLVDEQKKEMELKINVMEKIFGLREKKIQALSLVQKHILPSLWLNKIHVIEGSEGLSGSGIPPIILKISGLGTSVDDIQLYAKALSQEKAIFKSVKAPNIMSLEKTKSDLIEFKFEIVLRD